MNTKIIRTLMKKELLDVMHDKKTVVMMLVQHCGINGEYSTCLLHQRRVVVSQR